jgi:hypothetical protein
LGSFHGLVLFTAEAAAERCRGLGLLMNSGCCA